MLRSFLSVSGCLAFFAALVLIATLGHAGDYILQGGLDGFITVNDLYNTGTPIAVGKVTAIGGKKVTRPTCVLVVAGTHTPFSPEGLRDWQDSLRAGGLQATVNGSGGFPFRPILGILLGADRNNPLIPLFARTLPTVINPSGSPAGFNIYTDSIESALKKEAGLYCPPGSDLIVMGHSLGAMELQRIIASPFLKSLGLNLIEADLFGSPELKDLSDDARSVTQYYTNPNDAVANLADPNTALRGLGVWFPQVIANTALSYDPSRTLADVMRNLTQNWKVPQGANVIMVPSKPGCSLLYNHIGAYRQMPLNIRLAPSGDGTKTIDLDNMHHYAAVPNLDRVPDTSAANSCALQGSVEHNELPPTGPNAPGYWQRKNANQPEPPHWSH